MKLTTYLSFAGNAEEAFKFHRSVFGGEFSSVMRFKDMPMPGSKTPKEAENMMMHIALPIGKDVLMASDSLDSLGQKMNEGSNVYLSLHPESKEEADRVFTALSSGGVIEMPIAFQPWGDYWGSFRDKYGVLWMVGYTPPKK